MGLSVALIDDLTGKVKRSGQAPFTFNDEDFDVGAGGQTNFPLVADIGPTTKIDFLVNGQMLREGATFDWQRDTVNDEINTNFTIPENAWVRVRVYG